MPKEKVTLTLDRSQLRELRKLTRARSTSAAVSSAISATIDRMRHLTAVDEWLAELERKHGPVPGETLEWAARLVERWETDDTRARRRAG